MDMITPVGDNVSAKIVSMNSSELFLFFCLENVNVNSDVQDLPILCLTRIHSRENVMLTTATIIS